MASMKNAAMSCSAKFTISIKGCRMHKLTDKRPRAKSFVYRSEIGFVQVNLFNC